MDNKIEIMYWNANGLLNHQLELHAILDIKKIDVRLISETHFTKQTFIKFRRYEVYHTTHPGIAATEGSSITVKENVYHNEEVKIEAGDIQAMALNIKSKKYNMVVVRLYNPPKPNIKAERYVELFKNLGNRFIIGETSMQNIRIGDRGLLVLKFRIIKSNN